MSQVVHLFFEHPYIKVTIAFTICVVLAFVDRIKAFDNIGMYYILCIIIGFILLSNIYNDYGLLLLVICLLVMTHAGLKSET